MNKRILALAIPNIISNITVPLLGMVDLAIAGRLGSDTAIGAIAVGTAIFNFIYWNCAFLRMGTSGFTAQAYGARRLDECANLLVRAMTVAVVLAVLLLVFQLWVGRFSLWIMQTEGEVRRLAAEYFFARIWAAPATVSLYATNGWFIGMQNSRIPMVVAIVQNIVNVIFSLWFSFGLEMGITGIAWGTVVSQYTAVAMSWGCWLLYYRRFGRYISWRESLRLQPMLRFFNVNKDIFLRTACIVAVYTFFTSASSAMGQTLLAVNMLLMQLFTLFSYMSDGVAHAAEALTGNFIGARNPGLLRHAIRNLFGWSAAIAALYVAVYLLCWRGLLGLFTDSPQIIGQAGRYVVWVVLIPLCGFAPFLLDGIILGATKSAVLRNSMFLATAVFFATYYALRPVLGNDALWLAFIVFLIARGLFQYFMADRLRTLIPE